MVSVLSSIHSLRALVKSGAVNTPEELVQVCQPLLELMKSNNDMSIVEYLLEMIAERLMRDKHDLSDIRRFDECRKSLEKKAQPYCSAGDLDALPMDLLSHSLSFLSYQDRIPVECVCRSLFALSRNTPIFQKLILSSELYDHHMVVPEELELDSSIPKENLFRLDISHVHSLTVWNSGNSAFLMNQSFPVLESVALNGIPFADIIADDRGLLDFVSDHRVLTIQISQCGTIFMNDLDTLRMILSNQHRNLGLYLSEATMGFHSAITGEGLELDDLWIHECDMNAVLLGSLVHSDLEWLGFYGGMLQSPEDGSKPDWSFFDLPNLRKLELQCRGCLTLKALSSIIHEYGPLWDKLDGISLSLGQLKSTELCDFIERCSILPMRTLSLSISILQPGDPSIKMDDISDILTGFPYLKHLHLHFTAVDPRAESTLHQWMVELYHLNQGGQINVDLILGDGGILDRFKQVCMDHNLVGHLRRWIRVDSSHSIFD